jgi:plasmid replication initiation protein
MEDKFMKKASALIGVIKTKIDRQRSVDDIVVLEPEVNFKVSRTFTELEQKVHNAMQYFANKQKQQFPDLNEFEFSYQEFRELFSGLSYRSDDEIKKAILALYNTSVTVVDAFRKEKRSKVGKNLSSYLYDEFHLIQDLSWRLKGVVFTFPRQIEDRLLNPVMYAKLPFDELNSLSGTLTLPLYEILKDYERIFETPVFDLKTLKKVLGIRENATPDFSKFKERTLNRIITEISENTSITVEIVNHRSGRKVVGVSFRIVTKDSKLDAVGSTTSEKVLDSLIFEGISEAAVTAIKAMTDDRGSHLKLKIIKNYKAGHAETVLNVKREMMVAVGYSEHQISVAANIINNNFKTSPMLFIDGCGWYDRILDEKDGFVLVDSLNNRKSISYNNVVRIADDIKSGVAIDNLKGLLRFVNNNLVINGKTVSMNTIIDGEEVLAKIKTVKTVGNQFVFVFENKKSGSTEDVTVGNQKMIDLIVHIANVMDLNK